MLRPRNQSLPLPSIHPLGDSALSCTMPPPATLACQHRIWAIAEQAAEWPHVLEVVPGMNNLTLVFDPRAADPQALSTALLTAWQSVTNHAIQGRKIEIPVLYGGVDGPDLDEVARHTGLTPQQVIERHSAAEYVVYFIGFMPGFAYMGGLDPRLATPRRPEPRLSVPAGSVGIGGEQTAIYPSASPGGWQLIGRSTLTLFDP